MVRKLFVVLLLALCAIAHAQPVAETAHPMDSSCYPGDGSGRAVPGGVLPLLGLESGGVAWWYCAQRYSYSGNARVLHVQDLARLALKTGEEVHDRLRSHSKAYDALPASKRVDYANGVGRQYWVGSTCEQDVAANNHRAELCRHAIAARNAFWPEDPVFTVPPGTAADGTRPLYATIAVVGQDGKTTYTRGALVKGKRATAGAVCNCRWLGIPDGSTDHCALLVADAEPKLVALCKRSS